ncbi:MAG: hypothetical protein J6W23_14155, partial [Victivallales bacterium]|nr:hypothetical protein [Victivallales bacterium]
MDGHHVAILECLGKHLNGLTRSEIMDAMKLKSSGGLTQTLEELEECGFIRRYSQPGHPKTQQIFQLFDNFTLFHYQFMANNRTNDAHFWTSSLNSPMHAAWTGLAFERVCMQHIAQIQKALGISGVICNCYAWRYNGKSRKGAQIDLVIDRQDNIINLCEIKFSRNPFTIDREYSENLQNKLDAFIEELVSQQGQPFQPTGRRIILDTVTIHNKESGVFYSPHQLLYYTTEQFNTNHDGIKYHYKLSVVKPDGDTATAETGVVSGNTMAISAQVNFQSEPTNNMSNLMFSSTEEAILYEIVMQFNYRESHPGQPLVQKEVSWSFGTKRITEYEKVVGTENCYKLYYDRNMLFTMLESAIGNDTVWDVNHPNVIRYADDFVVSIAAAGEDFGH